MGGALVKKEVTDAGGLSVGASQAPFSFLSTTDERFGKAAALILAQSSQWKSDFWSKTKPTFFHHFSFSKQNLVKIMFDRLLSPT